MAQLKTSLHNIVKGDIPWEDLFSGLNEKRGADPLASIRERALDFFLKKGFPTNHDEEWKYTSILPLLKKNFNIKGWVDFKVESWSFADVVPGGTSYANRIVFLNGEYEPNISNILDADCIDIISFDKSTEELKANVISCLFDERKWKDNSFHSFHAAFVNDISIVRVKKNKVPAHPLMLVYVNDAENTDSLSFSGAYIDVEENAALDIIEVHHSIGEKSSWSVLKKGIRLDKSARVRHLTFQDDQPMSSIYNRTEVWSEEKANYSSWTISLGGEIVRNELNVRFAGTKAEAILKGLYLPNGKSHIDNHTVVDHAVPSCHSDELYKGAMDGNAKGVFNGIIYVRQDAQKTTAYQSNKNLLLSPTAEINTKPQLEIFADDVKCSHGATTGRLDENAMFYLRTRGISETAAKALLTYAFSAEVLESIPWEALKEALDQKIMERFHV